MMVDLGYYNARVRGMRRHLLKAADYMALVKSRGYDGFTERLKSTAYGPYLEVSGIRFDHPGDIISSAIQTRLEESLVSLWAHAPASARPVLKQIFASWEASDIKAIIRGIARGVGREGILGALIPAGEFGAGQLGVLAGAPGIRELAGFLDTWGSKYAEPVKKGLPAYLKRTSTIEMEINIDRFVSGNIQAHGNGAWASDLLAAVSALRVDMRNTLTLLNTAGRAYQSIPAEDLYFGGGSITKKQFGSLLRADNRASLLKALSEQVRDHGLRETLRSADPADLILMEESFDAVIERKLLSAAVIDPLSVYLSSAFAYTIVREMKNLMLVSRAKGFGIPDDEVERLLMTVH